MTSAGRSPPKHRHDGTSPLPLGMDASPAPSRWNGGSTVWPHDPRTGWSYCVLIPSWIVLPDARTAEGVAINPTVYFRVQAGIQSPQGVSVMHGTLRRFSDFLKLHAALKRAFPKKKIPAAPPKNSLLRMNSSHSLLQERRRTLEEWMERLLSDIDISRSAAIASFLELEAAAREAVNMVNEGHEATAPVLVGAGKDGTVSQSTPNSGSSFSWTGGVSSERLSTAEYGSDSAYNTSGVATPVKIGESGLEIEMEAIVNSNALEAIKQALDTNKKQGNQGEGVDISETNIQESVHAVSGNVSQSKWVPEAPSDVNSSMKVPVAENELGHRGSFHQRVTSYNSIVSEFSSARDSEQSVPFSVHGPAEYGAVGPEFKDGKTEGVGSSQLDLLKGIEVALPKDHRGKLNRLLIGLQRRVTRAKTDMEDLITKLNQETAVKEFLTTKVRDLEGELDNTRRKSKDVLRQAVSAERERVTNLQWELEDARVALVNAQETLEQEQLARKKAEEGLQLASSAQQKSEEELKKSQEKCKSVEENFASHEAQARSDRKVMAKEIKAFRKVHPEVKEQLQQALQAKQEIEAKLEEQKQKQKQDQFLQSEFLREVGVLRQRLQECSVDILARNDDESGSNASLTLTDAIDLLDTSDNRISFLLAEAQLLAQENKEDEEIRPSSNGSVPNGSRQNGDHVTDDETSSAGIDCSVRKILTDFFLENAQLRRSVNSWARKTLLSGQSKEKNVAVQDPGSRKSVLSKFLQG